MVELWRSTYNATAFAERKHYYRQLLAPPAPLNRPDVNQEVDGVLRSAEGAVMDQRNDRPRCCGSSAPSRREATCCCSCLARRPVTLRPVRSAASWQSLGLRLVLAGPARPLSRWTNGGDRYNTTGGVAAAPSCSPGVSGWCGRGEELRAQIHIGCRGLFVGIDEAVTGRLQLRPKAIPSSVFGGSHRACSSLCSVPRRAR